MIYRLLVLGLAGVVALAGPASADVINPGTTLNGATIELGQAGAVPTASSGGGPSAYVNCRGEAFDLTQGLQMLAEVQAHAAEFPLGYEPTFLVCDRVDGGPALVQMLGLNPRVDAETVAQQAAATLTVGVPSIETAPGVDGLLLVGLRTWFWVGNAGPVSATASIPGLSATVTARAVSTTFTSDDGAAVTCEGGGAPYDKHRSGAAQDQTCTHVFQEAGDHVVTAATTWALDWTATNGVSGTLPDLVRTSQLTLPLRSAEAATD